MGACTFATTAIGKTADEAYRNACENARADRRANRDYDEDGDCSDDDCGDDSYSGDITTTSGFVMVDVPKGTRDAGRRKIVDEILENHGNRYGIDKWGPAGCIDLGRDKGMPRGHRKFYFFGWASE